jgi:glycosyltransferase involved in cell wall biosynthesis
MNAMGGLLQDVRAADALLINGIFTFPVTIAQIYAVLFGKPFIVATRGGLEPWSVAHKKWKKYFYIKLVTLPLMRRARFIHVTSDKEEQSIRALGFSNIIKVTNGIDLEMYDDLPGRYSYDGFRDERFVILFMSRTDKEKGLDILIEAYRKFCLKYLTIDHLLLIVGPDHQGYLKRFNLEYKKENIEYINGVYGDDKIRLIRRADVVVLPSYSENFGNIIAEALACERPVITTTGTPWKEVEQARCGLCIQPECEKLFLAMEKVYLMSREKRDDMGRLGRAYIINNFSWKRKAEELSSYLEKLVEVNN